ncbi:hypothetical protein [Sphingomonas aurantiaca]|uniref:hypothetical protein n=1 Tax=Sphingomonas aurantiaca TaxID=185949 RepID=UPI00335183D3
MDLRRSLPQSGMKMIVCLYFEDTKVANYEADGAPAAGASVTFRMGLDKNGLGKGWLVQGRVSTDNPPDYDFDTLAPRLLVTVTVHDVKACLE